MVSTKGKSDAVASSTLLLVHAWPTKIGQLPMGLSWSTVVLSYIYSFQMRSGRTFGSGGGGGHAGTAQGYSSSEDDEMTRLKPAANSGTSTSGGSSSGARRTPRTNCRNQSNSEGATSPNESDNTYAEASLLHNPRPIRYGECNSSLWELRRRRLLLLHSVESFVCEMIV